MKAQEESRMLMTTGYGLHMQVKKQNHLPDFFEILADKLCMSVRLGES